MFQLGLPVVSQGHVLFGKTFKIRNLGIRDGAYRMIFEIKLQGCHDGFSLVGRRLGKIETEQNIILGDA